MAEVWRRRHCRYHHHRRRHDVVRVPATDTAARSAGSAGRLLFLFMHQHTMTRPSAEATGAKAAAPAMTLLARRGGVRRSGGGTSAAAVLGVVLAVLPLLRI